MKKKEISIIFLLAVLVTALSWFITHPSESACLPWPIPFVYYIVCIHLLLPAHLDRGHPVPYWKDAVDSWPRQISCANFSADLLFWFLVLAAGWWVVKRIKQR